MLSKMASNNHRGEILQGKGLDLSRLAQWQLGSSTTNPLVNSNLSSKPYFLKKNWSISSDIIHDYPKHKQADTPTKSPLCHM